MSKEEAVTATLKQRLSAIQDKEIYYEDRDNFSEDGVLIKFSLEIWRICIKVEQRNFEKGLGTFA